MKKLNRDLRDLETFIEADFEQRDENMECSSEYSIYEYSDIKSKHGLNMNLDTLSFEYLVIKELDEVDDEYFKKVTDVIVQNILVDGNLFTEQWFVKVLQKILFRYFSKYE